MAGVSWLLGQPGLSVEKPCLKNQVPGAELGKASAPARQVCPCATLAAHIHFSGQLRGRVADALAVQVQGTSVTPAAK